MTLAELGIALGFNIKEQDVDRVNSTIAGIKDTATRLLGAIGIGFSLAAINGMVEEFTRVNNQIKSATDGLGEQREIQDDIAAAAEATRTSYSMAANTISLLVKGNRDLFSSVDEATDFYNSATMLFKSAGKTNEDIASLMEAMNQSFARGYIDSETISQLLERAPEAVDLLNKRLGTTSSQLEDMATDGKITVEDLKGIFVDNAEEISASFDDVQYNITDALTVIQNKWGLWLAQTNETLGLTDGIGRMMVNAFNNVIGVLNRVRNGVVWLSDKLGGVDNMFRLIAMTAGALFVVLNFGKITSGLTTIGKLLTSINVKTLVIFAAILALVLLVDDFINFMQGNNSLLGTMLERAGIDAEAVRETIINAWESIKDFLAAVWDNIKSTCTAVWNGIRNFFTRHGDEIKAGLTSAWDAIRAFLLAVWGVLSTVALAIFGDLQEFWTQHGEQIKSALTSAWTFISSALIAAWDLIKNVAETVFGGLQTFWQNHGEQVTEALVNAWNAIVGLLTIVWAAISAIAITVFGILETFWNAWGDRILSIFSDVWNAVKAVVSTTLNVLTDLFAVFAALLSGDWEALWRNAQQLVSDVFNGVVNIISTLLTAAWNIISAIFSMIYSFIAGIASGIWGAITTAFTNILTSITSTVGGIRDTIVEGFQEAIDWITSLPEQAVQWGADIINAIVDGITGAVGAVGEAVSGVADKIKSFLGFSVPEDGPLSDFDTYMPDMIDLMVKGITEGKARVSEALQGLAGDMSVMATANVVSPRTAATATGSNQINRTVVLNSNINNTFNGERAAQQRMAGAAKQSARDVTSELARGLAYAR